MPDKKKGTSPRVATEASDQVRDPRSTNPERSVAGSDLNQAGREKKPKKKPKKKGKK